MGVDVSDVAVSEGLGTMDQSPNPEGVVTRLSAINRRL